jgi:hypothetical protein
VAEPRLIADYRSALSRRLPEPLVDEIADGLAETYEYYVATGIAPDQAAQAALAEFGDADTIAAAFAIDAPARRTARALLAMGPATGACWALALISEHAWRWFLPGSATAGLGIALAAIISLLACAARSGSYRLGRRAMTAACLALIALDCSLIAAVALPDAVRAWPVALAVTAGAVRVCFTARALRRVRLG